MYVPPSNPANSTNDYSEYSLESHASRCFGLQPSFWTLAVPCHRKNLNTANLSGRKTGRNNLPICNLGVL